MNLGLKMQMNLLKITFKTSDNFQWSLQAVKELQEEVTVCVC